MSLVAHDYSLVERRSVAAEEILTERVSTTMHLLIGKSMNRFLESGGSTLRARTERD